MVGQIRSIRLNIQGRKAVVNITLGPPRADYPAVPLIPQAAHPARAAVPNDNPPIRLQRRNQLQFPYATSRISQQTGATTVIVPRVPAVAALAVTAILAAFPVGAASPENVAKTLRRGNVKYTPPANEDNVPPRFRLPANSFSFEQRRLTEDTARVEIFRVTFPSPVKTPHDANNTVHCEYFRPKLEPGGNKKMPGVVVLHILGGDFPLSRLFASALAQKGCAALFVKMPYYGPRRPPGTSLRMVSRTDPEATVAGMTQAVLDVRRAAAWLAAQDEVDPKRLGVFGISLGGITASLAATAEPRFTKICPMLAGGDIARVTWESRELARVRDHWTGQGKTKEQLFDLLKVIDPVTYAANVRGREILMLNASRDEVIPRACTESLWNAFGRPRIVWYDAGHISALRYLLEGITEVTNFFKS
jgi:dienelactone hydrolase